MTKTFRDNCDKNIAQQKSCEPLFPDVQMQSKMYFFVPFVRPCMHYKYGGISESLACKHCVWPIILDADLYTTCPGERVLIVMTHQVQGNSPTFEALLRKNRYLFLERCRRSNNVWLRTLTQSNCSFRPYSLNTASAFYFVTECSNIAVFVRLRVYISQCIRTLPGFDQFRN